MNFDGLYAWTRQDLVAIDKYRPDFFPVLERLKNVNDVAFAWRDRPSVSIGIRQSPAHVLHVALFVVVDGSDDTNDRHGFGQAKNGTPIMSPYLSGAACWTPHFLPPMTLRGTHF